MSQRIGSAEIDEHEHVTLMDRVVLNDGTYMTQSDVTSITVSVVGREGIEHENTLDKTAVVFDTLQTDGYWNADRLGYNLRYTLDTENIMAGGRQYMVIIAIETTFGPKYSKYQVKVRDLPTVDSW